MSFVAGDFDLMSSNLIFDSSFGQDTVFTVNIIDDTKYEPADSSFMLMLVIVEAFRSLGVALGENSTAIVSIIDNDS